MEPEKITVTLTVNGNQRGPHDVPADLPLVDYLHDDLNLTGTKFCCGIAVCRACTVAVRPRSGAPKVPVLSCSTPVSAVNGQEIFTIEGLAAEAAKAAKTNGAGNPGQLAPLQDAFLRHFAFQCGYCTSGFLMAATILLERLRERPIPLEEVDAAIADSCGAHICRCTGYVRYYEAIREVIVCSEGLVL